MNTNRLTRPNPLRCAALVLLSLTCATFLIELDSSTPWPPLDPDAFFDWWDRHGTATAAITLLRIAGTTLAGWGTFIGTAGLVASVRPSTLFHGVWRRVTPSSFRHVLAASAITVTLAAPAVAGANPQGIDAQIVLEDLGQHVEPARLTPVLTDLGPITVEISSDPVETTVTRANSDTTTSRPGDSAAASSTSDSPDASHSQSWTVVEGDHLWKIAEKTLRDRGYETESASVVTYWQQLIDVNSEVLNGHPDLIHPGLILTLPPVQPPS